MGEIKIKISGAGVMSVNSKDIFKTKNGKRQFKALGEIKMKMNEEFEKWWLDYEKKIVISVDTVPDLRDVVIHVIRATAEATYLEFNEND